LTGVEYEMTSPKQNPMPTAAMILQLGVIGTNRIWDDVLFGNTALAF
jgi:hypothetical protein